MAIFASGDMEFQMIGELTAMGEARRVGDLDEAAGSLDRAAVADLPSRLGVKGRAVEDDRDLGSRSGGRSALCAVLYRICNCIVLIILRLENKLGNPLQWMVRLASESRHSRSPWRVGRILTFNVRGTA